MSAGTQPATKPSGPEKKSGGPLAVVIIVLVVACCVGSVVYPSWNTVFGNDRSNKVPPPTAQERAGTVPILAQSAAGQGLCYGWVLKDYWEYGDDVISAGSNLGDGVRVEEHPSCPRWVQVAATVRYVSESSESNDTAAVEVTGSPDLDTAALWQMQRGLERFGLTDEVFVDDPGWATTRAAVMLPLLAAEAGLVPPAAAAATPPVAASPSPLPDTGSDLLRDRWGYLVAVVGLLLLAGLFVTVGVVQRRRQLRGVVPAQRAGAEAAGRTREKA